MKYSFNDRVIYKYKGEYGVGIVTQTRSDLLYSYDIRGYNFEKTQRPKQKVESIEDVVKFFADKLRKTKSGSKKASMLGNNLIKIALQYASDRTPFIIETEKVDTLISALDQMAMEYGFKFEESEAMRSEIQKIEELREKAQNAKDAEKERKQYLKDIVAEIGDDIYLDEFSNVVIKPRVLDYDIIGDTTDYELVRRLVTDNDRKSAVGSAIAMAHRLVKKEHLNVSALKITWQDPAAIELYKRIDEHSELREEVRRKQVEQ